MQWVPNWHSSQKLGSPFWVLFLAPDDTKLIIRCEATNRLPCLGCLTRDTVYKTKSTLTISKWPLLQNRQNTVWHPIHGHVCHFRPNEGAAKLWYQVRRPRILILDEANQSQFWHSNDILKYKTPKNGRRGVDRYKRTYNWTSASTLIFSKSLLEGEPFRPGHLSVGQ